MKKQFIYAAVLAVGILGFTSSSFAQFSAGISIGDRGGNSFYMSIGEYYNVPQREVVVVHERSIPDDEIPVVFYIARHAHVAPVEVVSYRKRGCSWWEVSQHFGLGPDIYGRTAVVQGPPYGNAWGHYKHNKHRNDFYMNDGEIVNYVNTSVVCDRYGCSRDEVYRMRNQGYGFAKIHDRYYGQRHGNDRVISRDRDRVNNTVIDRNHDRVNDRVIDRNNDRVIDQNGNGHGNGHGKGNHGHGRWND